MSWRMSLKKNDKTSSGYSYIRIKYLVGERIIRDKCSYKPHNKNTLQNYPLKMYGYY